VINSIAEKWASWIKANDPDFPASEAVIRFGAAVGLNLGSVVVLSLVIGLLTGTAAQTMLSVWSFVLLRMFSSGFHFKSLDVCTIISTALLSALPHVTTFIREPDIMLVVGIAELVIVAIRAPTNLNNTRHTDKVRPYFKVISILIVISNFYFLSPVVALSFLAQALLLLPRERR
jgi:accessory gene regulator B